MPSRLLIAAAVAAGLVFGFTGPVAAKSDKAADKAADKATAGAAKAGKGAGSGGSGTGSIAGAAAAGAVLAGILLSDQDRHTISSYFQHNPLHSQPLPPGIAKNLARGKPLPPGIAKRGLPNALTSRLSIPSGYELLSVGTDVLLVAIGTRIIADVLRDVAHD